MHQERVALLARTAFDSDDEDEQQQPMYNTINNNNVGPHIIHIIDSNSNHSDREQRNLLDDQDAGMCS